MKTMCISMSLVACIVFSCLAIDLARSGDKRVYPPFNGVSPPVSYGDQYYARRWNKLCRGGGRYQAMAEAHEIGKPNPCESPYRCTPHQREAGECL